jgi:para-nitrobenzyl esterase
MHEDCLFLNVWTPAVDDARRPTMVWIHGGAFAGGSGSTALYDGAAFVRDDVVLVTINYRLHALGFLYLDELFDGAEGTGNLGIADQVAALEWVRDNIAAFGGDPNNVTIFGESAGGMSVGTLLGTPRATGLFGRAICMSGAGHHNLSTATATRVARRVLERLDVGPGDWEALQAVPVDRVVKMATEVGQLEARGLLGDEVNKVMAFEPVVDGPSRSRYPIDMVRDGSASGVELMVGTCAEEWRLFIWGLPPEFQELLPEPDISAYFAPSGRSVDEVLKVYGSTRTEADRRDLLAAVQTDQMFTIPAVRLAEAQLAHRPDVWMYRFSWRTPALDGVLGACHAIELPFVFEKLGEAADFVGEAAPAGLAADVHQAWVSFAATGKAPWPAYDTERRPVMDFNAVSRVIDDPNAEERRLWDGLL